MNMHHAIALATLILAAVPRAHAAVLAGPIANAANAHTYYLLTGNTWTASEAEARALGGHLVTINDAAENQWVLNTFFPLIGVPYASLWIGLNDAATEGQFVWASGEPVTFTYWYPGEPNDLTGEDYATIRHPSEVPPTGSWNDLSDTSGLENPGFPVMGVVEVSPPLTLRIYPAIELEFTPALGQCYQIQYSADLATWLPLGAPVAGSGGNYNLLVSTKNTARRFYRLAIMSDETPGLVASYRFDGSPADCSINGNHGIAYNVTPAPNRFGRANAAYRFAGASDSYIRVPHSSSLNITNSITLAAWINFEVGGTVFPRIINKFAYELATGEYFRSTRHLYFAIKSPSETLLATPTEILQAGRWHFVTATYDGTLLLEYVDGALLAATVAPGGIVSTSQDLNIGRNAENTLDNFKGLIDDVRIYNRALSSAEITALFNETE